MRIAFVTGAFPKLSETFVLEQILGLRKLGHDVRIYAFENPGEAAVHEAVVEERLLESTQYLGYDRDQVISGLPAALRAGGVGLRALGYRDALARRLAHGVQGEFSVIYCHFGHIAERARQLRHAGFFDGPLVAVFHAADLTIAKPRGGYAPLFREAAKLLPISRHWRSKLVELGAAPETIEVFHMGVDCARIPFRPRQFPSGLPARIASVGRLIEKKGFEYGLHAVAKAETLLSRLLHYDVIGDGPLRPELEALVASLGLRERVRFHGPRTAQEVAALLDRSDVLLAPSVTAANGDVEGIPVVLMEAMARGLPVISSVHTGIPELVGHGESGLLAPERDPDALAEALASLLREPARWPALTANARRRVEAEFDSARLTPELAALFTTLTPSPGMR
jgi:colanic acid/amylovoran biosynthesis glycosyltransferase